MLLLTNFTKDDVRAAVVAVCDNLPPSETLTTRQLSDRIGLGGIKSATERSFALATIMEFAKNSPEYARPGEPETRRGVGGRPDRTVRPWLWASKRPTCPACGGTGRA